jgi:hypothetical protein
VKNFAPEPQNLVYLDKGFYLLKENILTMTSSNIYQAYRCLGVEKSAEYIASFLQDNYGG